MSDHRLIHEADRISRNRARLAVIAAAVFLLVQAVAPPFFTGREVTARYLNPQALWAVTAAALLLTLATGGGVLNSRRIRSLVNDEISKAHTKASAVIGFWTAMLTGMAVYVLPPAHSFSGREAIYLTITPSLVVALLFFAFLEIRAHRDA